jgi:hypothetical protein
MPGDISFPAPGDLQLSPRFFGLFTPKELVRIAVPTAIAVAAVFKPSSIQDILMILGAFGLGLGLAKFKPLGRTLDAHFITLVRWIPGARTVKDGPLQTRDHAYFETAQGAVIGIIEVSPTNLAMQSKGKQQALHTVYKELLEMVTYPIEIHSRQHEIDLSEHITQLADSERLESESETEQSLRDSYHAYLSYLNETEIVETTHYITIRIPQTTGTTATGLVGKLPFPDSGDSFLPSILRTGRTADADADEESVNATAQQIVELDRRCNEVLQMSTRGTLSADRVTGPRLIDLAEDFHGGKTTLDHKWTAKQDEDGDGEYRKTLYITECPSQVRLAWPLELLQVNGLIDITQRIEPQNPADVTDDLTRQLEHLDAEVGSQHEAGYAGTHTYESRAADAEWLLQDMADRKSMPVTHAIYVTVHNEDKDRCLETLEFVKTRLRTMQFKFRTALLRTDQALKSQSPLHGDGLNEGMLMPASTAAAGFPFATTEAIARHGIVYGEDAMEKTPVLLNRFNWDAGHLARMGRTGSGKSYAEKLEVLRGWQVYTDVNFWFIDPKPEYADIVRDLGGEVRTFGPDTDYTLDRDDTPQLFAFAAKDLGHDVKPTHLIQAVRGLYQASMATADSTVVVIDETHRLMNHSPEAREALSIFVREARASNTAVTLLTQNASDFTDYKEGQDILDNTTAKIFHQHERVPTSVVQYFQLSNQEEQELYSLKTGGDTVTSEAIIKISNQLDTKITVRSTMPEHRIITAGEQGTVAAEAES